MAGLCLGAAASRIPVVVDGFIFTAVALVAVQITAVVPDSPFLFNLSDERAHVRMVQSLAQKPLFSLDLPLGEGTQAALAMHILEGAAKIHAEMATFAEAGVSERSE